MTKNAIKNVDENLFLIFGRRKTQNRAKTYGPSMSAVSAIFVLKKFGTQSHWDKFLNWGNHVNSVPDLTSPSSPHPHRSPSMLQPDSSFYLSVNYFKTETHASVEGKNWKLVQSTTNGSEKVKQYHERHDTSGGNFRQNKPQW